MAKRLKLKEGDVFVLPLSDGRYGVGQIIELINKFTFWIVVFDQTMSSMDDLESVNKILQTPKVLLLGQTTDALFYHNVWKVIINVPSIKDTITFPTFFVRSNGVGVIEDYRGNILREAIPGDQEIYSLPISFSPAFFTHSLEFHLGLTSQPLISYKKALYSSDK